MIIPLIVYQETNGDWTVHAPGDTEGVISTKQNRDEAIQDAMRLVVHFRDNQLQYYRKMKEDFPGNKINPEEIVNEDFKNRYALRNIEIVYQSISEI